MADLNLKATFSLIDRVTAPVRKITEATKGLSKGFDAVKRAASGMSERVKLAAGHLKGLNIDLKAMAQTAGLTAAASVTALTAGLIGLAKGVFDTAAEFEGYQATLETIEKSSDKAKESMAWIEQFSAQTPSSLSELTEAFVKMRAYGIDPTDGTMRSLGDAAAGMNKSMMDAVEMMADAQTGEFERLKEFGMRAKVVGKDVQLTFDGMTKTVKNDAASIRDGITSMFDTKFAGAMVKQTRTWNGLMTVIGRTFQLFQKRIADAGIFELVKKDFGAFVDWFANPANKEEVDAWAKKISDIMTEVYNGLKSVDWAGLIDGIVKTVKGIGEFIDGIGGFKTVMDLGIAAFIASLVMGLTGLIPVLAAVVTLFGGSAAGAAVLAFPITGIVAVLAALAAIAYLVWRNWDFLWGNFKKFIGWMADNFQFAPVIGPFIQLADLVINHWDKVTKFFQDMGDWLHNWFVEKPKEWWNALPEWFRTLLSGAFAATPLGAAIRAINAAVAKAPAAAPARPQAAMGGASAATVGGDVGIAVYDRRVAVESLNAKPNTTLTARTGIQTGRKS